MLKLPKFAFALALSFGASINLASAETASDKAFAAAMENMMQGMMKPPTGKPDLDFVTGMIPHHEGAVAMAKVEKEFGKDPAMLKLADDVIAAQTSEIALMKKWLSAKKLSASTAVAAAKTASTGAMDKMMKDMDVKPMGNADVDFAKGMVPHHQGAVAMANIELQYGTDADVKKLAEGVVKSQSEEITQMKAWLASHGG